MIRKGRKPTYFSVYLQMNHLRESLKSFDLLLQLSNSCIELIEFFKLEETVANRTFEQQIESHKVEV